jgi:hypothetical protein
MEPLADQVVEVSTNEAGATTSSSVDTLREQRIRFDGYFSGPTW